MKILAMRSKASSLWVGGVAVLVRASESYRGVAERG